MRIDFRHVKGKGTKETGIVFIFLSIVIFGIAQLIAFNIDSSYSDDKDTIYTIKSVSSFVLSNGVLLGTILYGLGQIMINTGRIALIEKERARNEGYEIKEDKKHYN